MKNLGPRLRGDDVIFSLSYEKLNNWLTIGGHKSHLFSQCVGKGFPACEMSTPANPCRHFVTQKIREILMLSSQASRHTEPFAYGLSKRILEPQPLLNTGAV
jgi:hypothetical protein